MTFYAVESKRQGMRSTGIVNEVFEWVERDGKRKPSEVQANDENTGMPLWAVEVLYRQVSFGRESNTTGTVTVQFVDALTGLPYAATFGSSNGAFRLDIADNSQKGVASGFGFSAYRADGSLFHQAYDPGSSGIPQTGIGATTNEALVDSGFISSHP